MSLNLNEVILAGRLTAAPELKATPNGITTTTFTVAVDRKVAKDAEKKTDFINVVAWRQQAEFVSKFFRKGSPIFVKGLIQTRSWSDQSGNKRYATEVLAGDIKFVESKNAEQSTVAPEAPQLEEISQDDDLPF